MERLLTKETRTGFFANSAKPTYVDFIVADYLFSLKGFEPDVIQQWPTLIAHIEKIYGLPKLKNYIATRPQSQV